MHRILHPAFPGFWGSAVLLLVLVSAAVFLPGPAGAADGDVLKKYFSDAGLPNNWVKGVFRDGDRVFVTAGDEARGGTVVFDPVEGKFIPLDPGPGFLGKRVTGWVTFAGKTYAATERALNVREGKKWQALDRFNQVLHNEELLYTDGSVLYAVAPVMFGGVLRFDGTAWTVVDRGSGTGILNNATSLLQKGPELFIGTTTNALFHFTGKEWRTIGAAEGIPGIWVTGLAETEEGVWIGTINGLGLYDGQKVKKFSTVDGISSNKIKVLSVISGRLIVGTMDGGISIRDRGRFRNVSMEQGLSDNRIEAIAPADGGIWVGTINGLNLVELR